MILKAFLLLCFSVMLNVAQAEEQAIHVVKFINFSCPICKSFENVDPKIASLVEQQGGKFVRAPMSWGTQTNHRDKFYYAVRNKYPDEITKEVLASFYEGAQEFGLLFENYHQIVVWLQQNKPKLILDWQALIVDADSAVVQESIDKSIQLAVTNGLSQLPAYVLIQNGKVVSIFDQSMPQTNKPFLMADEISKKIATLSTNQ